MNIIRRMTSMKRILATIVSVMLVATMAIGGSIAYLQDSDSAVNVMTMGNVFIDQHEKEWGKDDEGNNVLVDFDQAKPLYPYVGELGWVYDDNIADETEKNAYRKFTMNNVVDKYVTVENTGKSDAYVRTIIALEMGDYERIDEFYRKIVGVSYNDVDGVSFRFTGKWAWDEDSFFVAKINDKNYMVMTAVHQDAVKPGETTIPSLLQVYMNKECNNAEVDKVDGNKNGAYDILVVSQAVQTAGFEAELAADGTVVKTAAEVALNEAFYPINATTHPWADNDNDGALDNPITAGPMVRTAAELQTALDEATDGTTIIVADDIVGDVTVTQKPDVKITIDGTNHEFAGVLLVDGKSATYTTAGLTIKNFNFKADSISADACIRLGNGTNATRYTCNVTVENCTFDVPGAVGIKSYTGGDKNLTISNCTATANAHSLVQAKGIDGILVKGCKVYSKNGMNFNNSDNVTIDNCTVDVKGYAVRFGESSGGVGAAETYKIMNSSLKSANDDNDATIILRGTADNSTLIIENTTINGDPDIFNNASGATVVR